MCVVTVREKHLRRNGDLQAYYLNIYAMLYLNFKSQLNFIYNKINSNILKIFKHDNEKK
jgi:hypothetical protein